MASLIRHQKDLLAQIASAAKAGRSRVADGAGLYCIAVKGGPTWSWRFDYSHGGKRKTLSMGTVADTTLVEAREKRDDAHALLAKGLDPSAERKAKREVVVRKAEVERAVERGLAIPGSFRAVFEQWHKTRSKGWSPSYAEKIKARLTNDILPWLGDRPIRDINEAMQLACLRRVQARGAIESAHSTLQNCGQVFRFGVGESLCERNPAQGLTENLEPVIVEHMAAVTKPDDFAALMVAINCYRGSIVTRHALMLAAMLFQRPANLRAMRWADVDLERALWSIPSAEMKRTVQGKKSGRPHLVPLCSEAIALLRELHPLTGKGTFVFVAEHTSLRPMSENTLNMALRRMGIENSVHTSHGFRRTARTLLVERLGADPEIVEAQLAHVKSGPLGSAYDRAEYMRQRIAMMAMWGQVVADCAQGRPFPKMAPTMKAPAEKAHPTLPADDMKTVAKLVQRLAGKKVTAAQVQAAAAALERPRRNTKRPVRPVR